MVISPLIIGNPYKPWIYIPTYYYLYDPPLFYGNIGSLDPSTYRQWNNTQMLHKGGMEDLPIHECGKFYDKCV